MTIHRLLRTRLSKDSKLLNSQKKPSVLKTTTHRLRRYPTQNRRALNQRNHHTRRPTRYYGTRQRRFIHPRGKKNLDYYGSRATMRQDLHFLKGNTRLLRHSKMQLNTADDKLRKKAISRAVDNSREKSTIHTNDKVLQWTNIQQKEYYNKYLSLRR